MEIEIAQMEEKLFFFEAQKVIKWQYKQVPLTFLHLRK